MAEQLSWFDVASTQTLLDGSGNYRGIFGRQGFYAPPENFIEQMVPLQPGSRLRSVLPAPAVARVPLLIKTSSESNLITAVRSLRSAMNPMRGDGILQYQAADSTTRQLNCRLYQGLEGDESDGNRGPGWVIAPLVFRAFDPFWYDASNTVVNYTTFGSKTITNTGDVEFWPQWSIHGPTTNITLANTTTSKSLTLTITLGGSDVLTIDTRPGVKSILLNSTTNEYAALGITSALWSFATGSNSFTITLASTTGSTAVALTYKQRYLGV